MVEKYFRVDGRTFEKDSLVTAGRFVETLSIFNYEDFNRSPEVARSLFYETTLEITRRSHFPIRPSRSNCVFVWERLDDAEWFRQRHGTPSTGIYEVTITDEGAALHRADIALATLMPTLESRGINQIIERAHKYWASAPDTGARVEVLSSAPVRVVRRVS